MKDAVFYRDLSQKLPVVSHGEGIYLYDREGKRYIDGCSGALVSNIGHGVSEVADAVAEQVRRVAFAHLMQFANRPLSELANLIAEMAPAGGRTYFVSGGSEATETALKMARQYHLERGKVRKHKVIARWRSYHGNTLGALSMSGHTARRRKYDELLLDFPHIEPPYCYRCPYELQHPSCGIRCAKELELAILREGPENVSAFIAEPISGSSIACLVPPPEYLPMIREICDRYDVLFIADEVMTGFGRTGANFGVDHWRVVPDLMAFGKGISGGYSPLGGVLALEKVHEVFEKGSGAFVHGHTYGGNPVSAAAGLATLTYIKKHGLVQRAAQTGEYLHKRLLELADEVDIVGDVRGLGLMQGLEFVKDRQTAAPFDPGLGLTNRVLARAKQRGLLLYPGTGCVDGVAGDSVIVAPPLITTPDQIDEIVDILAEVLKEIAVEVRA